jgi:hypothetical protein
MRVNIVLVVLSIWASMAFADGLSPMPLKEVLPRADIVVLAEVASNDVTIVERKPEKGRASVVYTCNIKAKVVEELKASASNELDLVFSFTVVKGVWLSWPGSGLEQHMKPTEQYILLLTLQDGKLQLLRAEKSTELSTIKEILKEPKTENISCTFDSKKTATTEMLGLTDHDVGKKILGQAMLISKSDGDHIHVVFAEGGEYPKFIEQGVYDLSGEFKIHNPTKDGKPKKFPVANYRYFLVSSWKLTDAK